MKRLYPELKMAKPGSDFYTPMLFVEVIICIYIIAFYTNMAADKEVNIVE